MNASPELIDFSLSEEQTMIRDVAQDFLDTHSDSAAVRAAMDSETGFDPALWTRIGQEMGWCGIAIAEADGGLGLSRVALALLLEQMGRRLLCAPFFATVCLGATMLQEAVATNRGDNTSHASAAATRYLPRIAAGELTATLALDDGTDTRLLAAASPAPAGFRLTGEWPNVPDGAHAELLLLPARMPDGTLAIFAIEGNPAGPTRTAHRNLDLTRRVAAVHADNVLVDARTCIARGDAAVRALSRTRALAGLALAAEQVGGAQQCLDMTLAYIAERKQFGRTIASFQAIKHRCAEMMVRIEAARSAVFGASHAAAGGLDDEALVLDAACARVFASDAFVFCARESIQLHGGVGFTWEYDPHLYFKRAQAGSQWFGDASLQREHVARALLG